MPERRRHGQTRVRWRQFQHFVPAMKAHEYENWIGRVHLCERHFLKHWTDVSSQLIRSLHCVCEIASHAGAGCEEVKVVAIIQNVVHAAGCAALPEIYAVDVGRDRIATNGCRVVSYAPVG